MPSQARQGSTPRHSNFQARSVRDEAGEWRRSNDILTEGHDPPTGEEAGPAISGQPAHPYDPDANDSTPSPHVHASTRQLLHRYSPEGHVDSPNIRKRSVSGRRKQRAGNTVGDDSLTTKMHPESKKVNGDSSKPELRPTGGDEKLGMFSGVYVPTCLNVLSILMFLRFGFILGLRPLCWGFFYHG